MIYELRFFQNAFDDLSMSSEKPGRSKFSQAMADHGFRDKNFLKVVAVVDLEGVADELRWNLRATGPGLDSFFLAPGGHPLNLF